MAEIPEYVFREYDIRGLVSTELTPDFARQLGAGFGTWLQRRLGPAPRRIALGRDVRLSSPVLHDAFVEGLLPTGTGVVDLGVVATPVVYFAAHRLPVDGLAMITGSHNPPEFNGFKVGAGHATIYGDEIRRLGELVKSGDFLRAAVPGTVEKHDILPEYRAHLVANIRPGRRLRVVVDAGNGCGGFIAVPLLCDLGFEVLDQYCEPDGRFPHHHPDPTVPRNLEPLIHRVLQEKADVGIAYDGDADRIGAVDEKGRVLWGDQLMLLFAREILREKPGSTFVAEVKCSMTLFDGIERAGGRAVMWKAGHSLIKAKMAEVGAELAGEMSGHMFFKHRYYGFDDAVYATCRLLELLSHASAPLSALLADVPQTFSSPEIRRDFPEHLKFAAVSRVRDVLKGRGLRTVDVDGVRVEFPDGWGLVRASNTQPILVLRFEATTDLRLREIRRLVEDALGEVARELGVGREE